MPEQLYTDVVEVEERLVLAQPDCALPDRASRRRLTAATGDAVRSAPCFHSLPFPSLPRHRLVQLEEWAGVDEAKLRQDLEALKAKGVNSLAVLLLHSYLCPPCLGPLLCANWRCLSRYSEHERRVEAVAKEVGFENISLSSAIIAMAKVRSLLFSPFSSPSLTLEGGSAGVHGGGGRLFDAQNPDLPGQLYGGLRAGPRRRPRPLHAVRRGPLPHLIVPCLSARSQGEGENGGRWAQVLRESGHPVRARGRRRRHRQDGLR